jgi:ribonuclease HII
MLKSIYEFLPDFDSSDLLFGVDEVGRGAGAGPILAAVVHIPRRVKIAGINDSKKLTAVKREQLFTEITEKCIYSTGHATHEEIDKKGVKSATELSIKRAIKNLQVKASLLLIDGRDKFELPIAYKSLIRGDSLCLEIAAASIVAKVTRDRMMCELAKKFPIYGFERHKGYLTKKHLDLIVNKGVCRIHRARFLKNYQTKQKQT